MLVLDKVCYEYQDAQFEFSLTVPQNSIMSLMGPSGAGKSTLLSLVAGFIKPQSGTIMVNNESILNKAPYQRPFSMLFQEHNLFSHLSVRENIGLGLDPSLALTKKQRLCVEAAAEQVSIESLLNRLPEELSGGQRQRVALARCFVQPHPIWLFDEPFSALDPMLREEMLILVRRLVAERGITLLMVTHDINDAKAIATHFAFLVRGIVQVVDGIDKLSSVHDYSLLNEFVNAKK